ncbi:Poly [ADP-ribose] polymerase 3 [Blyttiomyces sp. JEL0837]|nr:Poly [ADP-ribose] polymerase 3 [Blyttiomyces sp. JEL0837]
MSDQRQRQTRSRTVVQAKTIFHGLVFTFALYEGPSGLVAWIKSRGGTIKRDVTNEVTHLIATDNDCNREKVQNAFNQQVFVVTEDFINKSIEAGKRLQEREFQVQHPGSTSTRSSTSSGSNAMQGVEGQDHESDDTGRLVDDHESDDTGRLVDDYDVNLVNYKLELWDMKLLEYTRSPKYRIHVEFGAIGKTTPFKIDFDDKLDAINRFKHIFFTKYAIRVQQNLGTGGNIAE